MKRVKEGTTVFVEKSKKNQFQALVDALNETINKLDKNYPEWRDYPSEVCDWSISIEFFRHLTDAELSKENKE